MRVVIIRHAEVDFCWSKRCTSAKLCTKGRFYEVTGVSARIFGDYSGYDMFMFEDNC